MNVKDFYEEERTERSDTKIMELMEGYAKQIVIDNFCDGTPTEFKELTVSQLKDIHDKVNKLVDWVNQ